MHLNTLKPAAGSKKKKVRVGRGWSSGLGKTSGRGQKGQRARGKGKVAIGFEGGQMPFHRRIPKSGFTSAKAGLVAELRLSALNNLPFDVVDIEALKLIDMIGHHIKEVKIIATGTIDAPVTIRGLRTSAAAKSAIEAAGGKVEA